MDKFERALPESERKAYREKNSIKKYAVNRITLAAFAGLYVFSLVGAVLLMNAVFRLLACAWVFTFEGHNFITAFISFSFSTFYYIAALLCRKGFYYCRQTLRKNMQKE